MYELCARKDRFFMQKCICPTCKGCTMLSIGPDVLKRPCDPDGPVCYYPIIETHGDGTPVGCYRPLELFNGQRSLWKKY